MAVNLRRILISIQFKVFLIGIIQGFMESITVCIKNERRTKWIGKRLWELLIGH